MKEEILKVKSNVEITNGVYRMTLEGFSGDVRPGQFLELKLDELFLRRPISICDYTGGELVLIYKTVGKGTEKMSTLEPETTLNALLPLGNGYDLEASGDSPLLIGGGVGAPPLYYLAKKLIEKGKTPKVILGFNTGSEVFLADDFASLGCDVTVVTVDGSLGEKGFPTEYMEGVAGVGIAAPAFFYSCGPLPMLKGVFAKASELGINGEFSLEERMGCGFGACMGCTIQLTESRYKRVCKDGPVFGKEDLPW